MMARQHQPVLSDEVLHALAIKPDGIYIDGTYGRGGHSDAILGCLGVAGRLIAIDRDLEAIAHAKQRYRDDSRVTVSHRPFSQLTQLTQQIGVFGHVNGILFDLGLSSPHVDDPKRGFSFMREGPLDMRMDNSCGMTAAEWLATVKASELANILYQYGEERHARRIAKAIVRERERTPITTTKRLADIIVALSPSRNRRKHPATRAFQAIRIFINQELEELASALTQSLATLAVGGRLAVISFHSLEDRLVKQFFIKQAEGEPRPRGLPAPLDFCPRVNRINGAVRPGNKEISDNPRARSAILRVVEKRI